MPAADDPAELREACLGDLERLFGPAAVAIVQTDGDDCRVVAAWRLPVGLPAIWPAAPLRQFEGHDTRLGPGAFGPAVGYALEAAGLTTAWRLPLPAEEHLGGAILLFYSAARPAPSPDGFELAEFYADQFAIRLANAELRSRLKTQRIQLEATEAVSEITAALNSRLGEPDVLQLIADRAQELLVSDGVAINLLEPDGRSVRTVVVSGERMTTLLNRVYTTDASMVARVTFTGKHSVWRAENGNVSVLPGIRAALIHPLTGPFGPIGTIGVFATESGRVFIQSDIRLLELFARQAALAITNARLLERSRQEAALQTNFNEVSEALLLAQGEDEILTKLVETAARLIPCETCYFAVYNSDMSSAVVSHAESRPGAPGMLGTWDPQSAWPDLLLSILKGDILYWSGHGSEGPTASEQTWQAHGIDSTILVPVLYRGWLIGVLGFANIRRMPNWLPLTPDLLRHLASQIASALATARLYEEAREHLASVRRLSERLHALNNVSVQIQAARHADEVFVQTFTGLRSLGLHAVVLGMDAAGEHLRLIAHSFNPGDTARVVATNVSAVPTEPMPTQTDPAIQAAMETREVQFCSDVGSALAVCYPDVARENLDELIATLDLARGVIAPLIARDRLLGLLVILGANLQSGDEAALAPLASQAAIALDKADLYDAMLAAYRFSESLIDSMSEGLVVVDTEGRHMLANRAFCDMVGYNAEELENRHPPHPYWPDEDDEPSWSDLQSLLAGDQFAGHEIAINLRRRDGTSFHAGMTPGDVHDERGRVTGRLVIVRDLTERESLEAAAAQAHAAREADRLKSELLSTVSHELRTPLAAIKGFTSTMLRYRDRLSQEEQREFLHDIEASSDRLAELVANLLNMSRLEAALLSMECKSLDLAPLLREEAAGFLPRINARQQTLVLDLPEQFPLVQADPRRMRQVFSNLLDNAAKYTPESGCVTLRAIEEADELLVEIVDTGPGIPYDHLGRIFEPFHRVDSRLTRTVGGTGLGLAITRRILDAHGGRVEVRSKLGEGTTFTVYLPIESPSVGCRPSINEEGAC
ncbi:MAG: ATP-binding protein [Chloroflexia bacterium]